MLLLPSYRAQLGKLAATTEAPSASPTETRAWEDLRKFSGPSLSLGAQSVLAETLPTVFAQHVLKTSSDAEPLPPSLAFVLYQERCSDFTILDQSLVGFM